MATEFLRGTNGCAFDFSKEVEYLNREKEIINEVDSFLDDPVFGKLMNRNAAIGLAKHFVNWADEHPREGTIDIESVCEWIKENIDHYIGHYLNDDDTYLDSSFFETFRKQWGK